MAHDDEQARVHALLSLREAAEQYEVSLATLRVRARRGELVQVKVRGASGPEWRVTAESVEMLGYRRRTSSSAGPSREDPAEALVRLEGELRAARRTAELERRRADDADRRIGEVMMECGRLKALLAAAAPMCATCGAALPDDRNAPVLRLPADAFVDTTVAEASKVVSYDWRP